MAARAATRAATARIPQVVWSEARPAPVVLVSGPEELLADRAVRRIRETLAAADPSLEVTDLDASSAVPGDLTTLASPSLFGEPRLVRVTAVERLSEAFLTETLRYLEAPDDGATLGAAAHRRRPWQEAARRDPRRRRRRHRDRVRGGEARRGPVGVRVGRVPHGGPADQPGGAAGARLRLPGRPRGNSRAPASSCSRTRPATSASAPCRPTTPAGWRRTPSRSPTPRSRGGPGRRSCCCVTRSTAVRTLVPIVAALAAKLRAMAKVLDARGAPAKIAAEFGMAPWQVERARRDAQGWQAAGLGRAIVFTATTDERVKGGARDPEYAVERLVTLIAARGEPSS